MRELITLPQKPLLLLRRVPAAGLLWIESVVRVPIEARWCSNIGASLEAEWKSQSPKSLWLVLSCAAVGQDRNMNQKQGVVVVSIVVSDVDCRGYAYARRVAQLA